MLWSRKIASPRLVLGLGFACLACQGSAQQVAPAAGAQPRPVQARITDAVPVEQLAKAPSVVIRNGLLSAKLYLPDTQRGFYLGSRFDWAGMIGSLTFGGHDFYRPWFSSMSPSVRDFVFQDGAAIAAANTAATGPVEEFNGEGGALGYAEAAPGGVFLKIGVGVLRRLDDAAYVQFRRYPIVDAGKRSQVVKADRVEFTHEVTEPVSGYGYHYTKTIRLEPKQPVMVIEHELRNTGRKPISTAVYNHNFLNIDGVGTSAGLTLTTAFPINMEKAPDSSLAGVKDGRFVYRASLTTDQRVSTGLTGFGPTAKDNGFHVFNPVRGAGIRITGDRPLSRVTLWSIQPVMAIEPFIEMTIAPGESFKWSYRYEYQTKPAPGF